jgi:hypothetical protein
MSGLTSRPRTGGSGIWLFRALMAWELRPLIAGDGFIVEQIGQHAGWDVSQQEDLTMDHNNHVRLATAELTPEILEGATIYGVDDEKVGKLDHLHGIGPGAKAVIDVGGFLGIGAKPVAVNLSDLDWMRDEDGDVHAVTTWTKDSLKDMPEHRD